MRLVGHLGRLLCALRRFGHRPPDLLGRTPGVLDRIDLTLSTMRDPAYRISNLAGCLAGLL